jgi:hypothetical protein
MRRALSLWAKANPPSAYTINPKKRGIGQGLKMTMFGIPLSDGGDYLVDWAAKNGYNSAFVDEFLVFAGTPSEFRAAYLQNKWVNANVQSYFVVQSEGHIQEPSETGMTWDQCYSWLWQQPEEGWYCGGG